MAKKVESDAPKTGVDRWREATHTEATPNSKSDPARGKKRVSAAVRGSRVTLVWAAVLCAVAVACGIGFFGSLSLGVDVSGGQQLVFTAWQEGDGPSQDEMSEAADVLRSRLVSQGISGGSVKVDGDTGLLVNVPATDDPDALASTIGETGKLEFVRVDEIGDAEAMAKLQNGTEDVELESDVYTAFLDGSHVTKAQVQLASSSSSSSSSSTSYAVVVTFDSEGAETFAEVTKELAETSGQIAIVVDGVVKSAPSVSSEIAGGTVSISGNFTLDEALQLKSSLDSGTLPVNLTYEEVRDLVPVLGVRRALFAFGALVALVAVVGVVAFRLLGLAAALASALTGALAFGCLAVLSAAGASFGFTLFSLAGLGLSVVLSAAGSFALFGSFRRAARSGKSIRSASVATCSSVGGPCGAAVAVGCVVAVVLVFAGAGDFQSLAIALSLGVACAAGSTLLVCVPFLRLAGAGAAKKSPALWGVAGAPSAGAPSASDDGDEPAEDGE